MKKKQKPQPSQKQIKKKKEKEREKHKKLVSRRLKDAKANQLENRRAVLENKSRRRQEPIVNHTVLKHKFEDSPLPMSQEREVEIVDDYLKKNLETLKSMEQEFVDLEQQRKEYRERLENARREDADK
jgi:hypothetical protein